MKALTHVKGMQWAVLITKSGFRFELFMMNDEKNIKEMYLKLKPEAQKKLATQVPTGKSNRYKICISHEGFDAVEHAKAFSVFHKYLMVGINELYPQETEKKSKTA